MPVRPTIQSDRAWFSEPDLADAAMVSSTPPVAVDGGISFTLPGGVATPDPGSGVWATWRLIDVLGHAVDVGLVSPYTVFTSVADLLEVLAPSLTSDSYVSCGICNNPDLDAATVEGIGGAIVYTGGTRVSRVMEIINGVVTILDDASPTGSMRRLMTSFAWQRPSIPGTVEVGGMNAAGSFTFYDGTKRTAGTKQIGEQYFWIAAGRTAATAGVVTLEARAKHTTISNRGAAF